MQRLLVRVVIFGIILYAWSAAREDSAFVIRKPSIPVRIASLFATSQNAFTGTRTTVSGETSASNATRARIASNTATFIAATGVSDSRVIELYAGADTNGYGYLSWPELETFQQLLNRKYRYKSNTVALRPDEFIGAGGGDCEDWALVTAGLCRFWGWPAYIGAIGPGIGTGHAVCLVRMNVKPESQYAYYHFHEPIRIGSHETPAGYYVPVDYQVVGGLSNAVERGWSLRKIYAPESLYGDVM